MGNFSAEAADQSALIREGLTEHFGACCGSWAQKSIAPTHSGHDLICILFRATVSPVPLGTRQATSLHRGPCPSDR
jgi:hypothetical protein